MAGASNPGNNGRLVYVDAVSGDLESQSWNEVFTMDADGTDRTRLTFDGGEGGVESSEGEWFASFNTYPAWSPQGDAIAYLHFDRVSADEIRLMDPAGRLIGVVTDRLDDVGGLSWSPDGERLVVVAATPSSDQGLWIVSVADGETRLVVSAPSDIGLRTFHDGVEWSPSGDVIAVGGSDLSHGHLAINLVTPDGVGLGQVEFGSTSSTEPEWSPDGGSIYCSAFHDDDGIWVSDRSAGSTQRLVSLRSGRPTAAPDGERILFVSGRQLWQLDLSHPTEIETVGDFAGMGLDWQPIQGSFWDDEGSVFTADIEWMAAEGITKGCNPPVERPVLPGLGCDQGSDGGVPPSRVRPSVILD